MKFIQTLPWPGGNSGAPDRRTPEVVFPSLIGVMRENDARATPGAPATAAATRCAYATLFSGVTQSGAASTRTISRFDGSNPSGVVASVAKVRTNKPAPTMSANDSPTWATTSAFRSPKRRSPVTDRLCSFMASLGSTPPSPNAGASPNKSVAPSAAAAVNPSTRQSIDRSNVAVLTSDPS